MQTEIDLREPEPECPGYDVCPVSMCGCRWLGETENPWREVTIVDDCECMSCQLGRQPKDAIPMLSMALCPVCGNKRCPKASNHQNECSGSNEPGQKGSFY